MMFYNNDEREKESEKRESFVTFINRTVLFDNNHF